MFSAPALPAATLGTATYIEQYLVPGRVQTCPAQNSESAKQRCTRPGCLRMSHPRRTRTSRNEQGALSIADPAPSRASGGHPAALYHARPANTLASPPSGYCGREPRGLPPTFLRRHPARAHAPLLTFLASPWRPSEAHGFCVNTLAEDRANPAGDGLSAAALQNCCNGCVLHDRSRPAWKTVIPRGDARSAVTAVLFLLFPSPEMARSPSESPSCIETHAGVGAGPQDGHFCATF